MRKTSRLEKTHLQTVIRYTRLAGEHAEQLYDELVEISPQDGGIPVRREVRLRLQAGKALRRKHPADERCGDNWDRVAMNTSRIRRRF